MSESRPPPAQILLAGVTMNDTDMQAERALAADVVRMAHTVQASLGGSDPPTVWKERRKQIAALRQRIRDMRARHLGGS
jgi:hypothetical protein